MIKKNNEIAEITYKKMIKEKKRILSFKKLVLIIIMISIVLTIIVEFAYATKYDVMIEVISSNSTIEISPIKTALDFGGLPPGSAESRSITLNNKGKDSTYVAILMFGNM